MTWKTTTVLMIAAAFAASMLSGCAAFYKTRPHDLTISGHEAAATTEDAKAARAAEEAKSIGRSAQYAHYMAPRYRELAEAHRAAARALHDKEDKACEGVPAAATGAPLAGIKIAAVDEIRQGTVPPGVHSAKGYYPQYLLGAKLELQGETSSVDAERLLACRMARVAAEGDDGVDPVGVRGTSVKVSAAGDTPLRIEIRSEDQPSVAEVVRRARALAAR